MKVQMSSGVDRAASAPPTRTRRARRPAPRGRRSRSRRRRAAHQDHVLELRAAVADLRGSSPAARRPRRSPPWRRSSRARTGTPRASWSGRSGRRSRPRSARRSRSRSTRGGCWRGSRPCRPSRSRGRSGRARGRGRSRRPRRRSSPTQSPESRPCRGLRPAGAVLASRQRAAGRRSSSTQPVAAGADGRSLHRLLLALRDRAANRPGFGRLSGPGSSGAACGCLPAVGELAQRGHEERLVDAAVEDRERPSPCTWRSPLAASC